MLRRFVELWKDEAGPTSVEYALMLVLVSIVAILAWTALGAGVNASVEEVNKSLPAPAAPP